MSATSPQSLSVSTEVEERSPSWVQLGLAAAVPRPGLRDGAPRQPPRCVASSATSLLCSGARPAPAGAPAPLPLFTESLGLSLQLQFQASAIPQLPCLTPNPPEPHLRRCHGNGERQALAAKGAPERGPRLRLGRGWGCSRRRQANLLFPGLQPAPDQPWAGVGATHRMSSQSQVGRGRQASGHWY